MSILGSLIGGGLSLAGSLFGQSSEADLQKQFAKNAIQWKVKDAEKAGIHPLYALGANTVSYAPQGLGSSLSEAGQDIGRAVGAAFDPGEKVSAGYNAAAQKLQLQNMQLQNDKLASEIRLINQPATPPASPGGAIPLIPGQGDARKPIVPVDPDAVPVTYKVPNIFTGGTFDWQKGSQTLSQTVADAYGDAMQEVYGAYAAAADFMNNLDRWYPPDQDPVALQYRKLLGAHWGIAGRRRYQ